jgi:hypothetical protein
MRTEDVVPIMARWGPALDGGMEGDEGLGHRLTGRIGIETAVNGAALGQERFQPTRTGTSAGRGDTSQTGLKEVSAEGVNGRFAQEEGERVGVGLGWNPRRMPTQPVLTESSAAICATLQCRTLLSSSRNRACSRMLRLLLLAVRSNPTIPLTSSVPIVV